VALCRHVAHSRPGQPPPCGISGIGRHAMSQTDRAPKIRA
jgi:hypothetical protein